ncbi:AEC family transporter [Pseudoruegeria sp. SHC-113]|uniref:AEC family transporter n=1 Tax=Pseudoruegeria sp. SHC-113 TaxID=2855439 RepID=UPI0021BAB091|nr:AEC family transporter [Pseudoruegeria sp. SHC-113]MCT8159051.1 AEC family transporter [Pseudoruegeria sp. SHC-113]
MVEIFLKTLPFFGLIALGYWAGRTRFFSEEATAYLTKFVFYFALSAMLFKFSANLSLAEILDWPFIWAYLLGTAAVYVIATLVALIRKRGIAEAAVEAQCAVIGNIGFLGIPMLALLLGEAAIGYVMMMLAVDLIVFGSLIVILITGSRDGRVSLRTLRTVGMGLLRNPMIVSIAVGLTWSALQVPIPVPLNEFVDILGSAATPGALFAVGASLASKSAERVSVAVWLSVCKLALHPAAVAICALLIFPVSPYGAGVMIAAAALPVAGNIFMIAQHYGVAPQRVSAAILISTLVSVATVPPVIAWVSGF